MGLLEGIDPNPDNFVTAGIVHTRQGQVGYLLRLEPNAQAQVFNTENFLDILVEFLNTLEDFYFHLIPFSTLYL